MVSKSVKGYISNNQKDSTTGVENGKHYTKLREAFKGEVSNPRALFPKDLGIIHPFDFKNAETIMSQVGLMNGAINKVTDAIVGNFTVRASKIQKDATHVENAMAIINSFIKNTEFPGRIRGWVKEGLHKGNGFMELDLEAERMRVLNANQMYVVRDNNGNVKGYNQYAGDLSKKINIKKIIPFKPHKIAHLKINKVAGAAYGLGILYPNMLQLDKFLGLETDIHKLINRKAGAPWHVKVGVPGEQANPAVIDDVSSKLQFMNTRTEWPTDANVEIKEIMTSDVGASMRALIDSDMEQIAFGLEIPLVFFGAGNIAEGLAKVQLEALQRKAASIQEDVESIIEEKIFKPLLNSHGLDINVEFIWNLPGEEEINKRVAQLQSLLNTFNIGENSRRAYELEIARLLELTELQEVLRKPEKGLDDEEERKEEEERLAQPEVPGSKPNARESKKVKIKESPMDKLIEEDKLRSASGEMTVREHINIKELAGFNYSDYLVKILQRLKIDKFTNLAAFSDGDLARGLLSKKEVRKLRLILKDGFRKNWTIRQIENEIKSMNLPNRTDAKGNITSPSTTRPNMIARTETVRLSNNGLVDMYKDNGITEVRFLAALSDRTCSQCAGMDGQLFPINKLVEGYNKPPIHPNCRCSLEGVVE